MSLDPEMRKLLDDLAAVSGELDEQTPAEARALADEGMVAFSGPGDPSVTTSDRHVPGPGGEIAVRVYTPSGTGVRPLVVYFHGGGFVIGSIRTHDGLCRDLTAATDAVLVSVEYRLAPEHRFPAAVEDCFAALQWVHAHGAALGGDPARLAVAGDSAGGTLAAVTAMLAAEQGAPALRGQLLVYPGVGVTEDQASVRDNGEGYLLTARDIVWFMDHYLGPVGDRLDPRFDPIHAGDLSGVAPAHIITCEYDPLRDGGQAYAARLRADGVSVTERCYDGLIHGAFGVQAVSSASRQMIEDASAVLRAALSSREEAPTGA